MQPDHEVLNESEWHKAHRVIANWKNAPEAGANCPRCNAEGLSITDHSARPYSEWYELDCGACDLTVTMHVPQGNTTGAPV